MTIPISAEELGALQILLSFAVGLFPGFGQLLQLGGSLLGSALGNRGGGSATTRSTETGERTSRQTGTVGDTSLNVDRTVENPLLQPFRGSFLGGLQREIDRADQPIFGDAEKARFIKSINDVVQLSSQSAQQRLAGAGALNSGRAAELELGLEGERTGSIIDFFQDLPFREEQARSERLNPLLSAGLNFVGRGPETRIQTGDATRTLDLTDLTEFSSEREGTTTQPRRSLFDTLLGVGGQLLGGVLADSVEDDPLLRVNQRPPGQRVLHLNDVG